MTFPIQLAALGVGVIFTLYLIFKERNTAIPLGYGPSHDPPSTSYKPPSYDTHPLSVRNNDFKREKCVICLSALNNNTRTRKLPCKHVFHAECIEKWGQEKKYCPICRKHAYF